MNLKNLCTFLITTLVLVSIVSADELPECLIYKNYCFKDLIPTYKLLGEPTQINNKVMTPPQFRGNFATFAENYCSSIGYRIPKLEEVPLILDYLQWVPYEENHIIWLKQTQKGSFAPALNYKSSSGFSVIEYSTSTQGIETMCIKDISN